METDEGPAYPGRRARVGWVLYDFAQQPVFTLITTFIFAPYFAAVVAGDPVRGQSLWALAVALAGLAIAVLSPVLGAIADEAGRRKRWIAAFGVLQITACTALWWAEPGAVTLALFAFGLATLSAEFGIVFTNALMPSLAPPHRLGRLSGTGFAAGYVGGVLSLVVVLVFLTGGADGTTLLGTDPVLGLGDIAYGGERMVGPLSALWFAVFAVPFLLFTPDRTPARPLGEAIHAGLATLGATLRRVRALRNVMLFLLARMLYADGLAALFAFGAIYASGVFGWGTTELGLFGVLLALTAALGAYLGGRLDDALGPKPLVAGALVLLIGASLVVVGLGPNSVLGVATPDPDGLFAGTAERVYLGVAALIGLGSGPVQSASRTLLARLAPPDAMTAFYGLYAFSGRATSFAAPLLISATTALFASQKAAVIVVIGFLGAGLLLLVFVRNE
ncbi:MAG: MFS transporter, partial [Pseudomonadota bacterium]